MILVIYSNERRDLDPFDLRMREGVRLVKPIRT